MVTTVALVAVGPRLLGGASLTVLSDSMSPAYRVGDLLAVVPQECYAVGDAVTFQPVSGDPMLITHRVVASASAPDGRSYTTRGDANGTDDEPIVAEQIKGRVVAHLPAIGYLSLALGQNREVAVGMSGVALLAYGGFALVTRKKDR
ncbi:MAG: signal peptidase I [Salinibacterium sp.]|nr:signal peptidase I [Salinibacterium sp.]MBF0671205.1 signal peptidase I [Salinibacterium sp.]